MFPVHFQRLCRPHATEVGKHACSSGYVFIFRPRRFNERSKVGSAVNKKTSVDNVMQRVTTAPFRRDLDADKRPCSSTDDHNRSVSSHTTQAKKRNYDAGRCKALLPLQQADARRRHQHLQNSRALWVWRPCQSGQDRYLSEFVKFCVYKRKTTGEFALSFRRILFENCTVYALCFTNPLHISFTEMAWSPEPKRKQIGSCEQCVWALVTSDGKNAQQINPRIIQGPKPVSHTE